MSATAAMVVPDAIEVVVGHRCWLVGNDLRSMNLQTLWAPGERLEAICHSVHGVERYHWRFRRGGITLEEARQVCISLPEARRAHMQNAFRSFGQNMSLPVPSTPPMPNVEPPDGLGYLLERELHAAPTAACTCGIYAVTEPSLVPNYDTRVSVLFRTSEVVHGRVALWGEVVPGEHGWRAQYAYPVEFYAPSDLSEERRAVLESFEVPILPLEVPLPLTSDRPWLPPAWVTPADPAEPKGSEPLRVGVLAALALLCAGELGFDVASEAPGWLLSFQAAMLGVGLVLAASLWKSRR